MAGSQAAFPDVILPTAYVAQQEYSSNDVAVLQIDDNPANKTLRTFVQLGANPSFKYWITVESGDNYTVDWTNQDITNAIVAYFAAA